MKISIKLLIFLLPFLTNAQSDGASGNAFNLGIKGGASTISQTMLSKFRAIGQNQNVRMSNVTGSVYLNDMFLPTKLFYDNEFEQNTYYRFNAYNGELEVKANLNISDDLINALNKDKKISILVDNHKMSFKTFVTSTKKTLNGYLFMLLDGENYDLYKRVHVIFSPGRVSTNSFVKSVPSRFIRFTEYYFQKEGVDRIDQIVPNNRQFLKLLDDPEKSELKLFIKENKLNAKNQEDLVKIFKKLNK